MALLQRSVLPVLSSNLALPARRTFTCKAQKKDSQKDFDDAPSKASKFGGVAAAGLAASILLATSASFPEDALAARSGGRTGGSSFSSRRSAGPTVQNRTYNNYNMSPAPPVYGGFGGGFGYGYGGGISLFPTFVTPIGGGIFQFFFLAMIASTIIGIARSAFSSRRKNDDWDD